VAQFYAATPELIQKAIDVSQQAKTEWDRVPINDKIKLFLRVADEMATVHRADLNATTMLGQSKTIIQVRYTVHCVRTFSVYDYVVCLYCS
jgi:1-pyrroline-5-carboxylate dehydrogenase